MLKFLDSFQDKITGVLHCFDRLVFHGHLPVGSTQGMEVFLNQQGVLYKDLKTFMPRQADRLKKHAEQFAARVGRPYIYLDRPVRKEDLAREMAINDGLRSGLVAVFSTVEPCRTFALRYADGGPRLKSAKRKCLFLYYYFLDREFGLMHVRLQTWFPFQIQIYINGHEWLARKLDRHDVDYHRIDNAFSWIEDPLRAQRFADRLCNKDWPRTFHALAGRVNPLLSDLLDPFEYYWVTDQSEFSTDIMFRDRASLQTVYPKLLQHSTLCFSAEDVLTFLGKKLHPRFEGEVVNDLKHRAPGARVKHRVRDNWIKMYDKHGCVLRIETVINNPYDFKIRRSGMRKGEQVMDWFPMCKRVTNLSRYAQVSLQANKQYLDALSAVIDPQDSYKLLDRICAPAPFNGRRVRGFNPVSAPDKCVFAAVMRGENNIRGFTNGDIAKNLGVATSEDPVLQRRASARVSRILQRLRAHGLIRKVPRARRYRVTTRGRAIMGAAIHLREEGFPQLLQHAA
jgi:hypothetical protein